MEARTALCLGAALLAAAAGFLFMRALIRANRQVKMRTSLYALAGAAEAPRAGAHAAGREKAGLRNLAIAFVQVIAGSGFGTALLPVARWLAGRAALEPLFAGMQRMMPGDTFAVSRESVAAAILGLGVALFAVVCLVTQSLVCGCAVAGGLAAAGVMRARSRQDRIESAMRKEIPGVLQSMGRCFGSGMTFAQACQQLAAENHGALSGLFGQCARVQQAGGGTADALALLRENAKVDELMFLSVALDIQHRTGGSMKPMLEAVSQAIGDRLELAERLRVQTAQARLSARVVCLLPFVLLAMLTFVSPGYLEPFFGSVAGVVILLAALGLQAMGVVVVRRMLKVGE